MTRVIQAFFAASLAPLLWAGNSTAWETNTYNDFLKGRFTGVSLTRDGRLTLAPALETLAATGEAGVWSVTSAPDGTLYFSTGHRGRVYRLKPGAKAPEVLWSAPRPEVFALTLDKHGRLYAAASPDGGVWRIENGRATEVFSPHSKYVWALAVGADDTLYVGTGDQGRIYRVPAQGPAEVYYETGQAHVTALALDARGRLLAASEPNGILYRIDAKDQAFVLYDASLPEIRSIIPAPDGSIYVAALGGSAAQRQAAAATAAAAAQPALGVVTTSITVTADAAGDTAQTGVDLKPKPEQPKPAAGTTELPTAPQAVDLSAEKAAIYRISPDNLVETLWSSKEENVYDIALRDQDVLFSTDQRGRIYRLSADLKATLLVETREGETTRLLSTPAGVVAATSNTAKLFRLAPAPAATGLYESPVYDAGNAARWGHIQWRADGAAASLSFRTRSGNSLRPDRTWSEWSDAITDAAKAAISSPNARYIQWRVELTPNAAAPPIVDSVSISFQPQNNRPTVRSVQVTPQWIPTAQKPAQPQQAQAQTSYSITVTDSGDAQAAATGTPTQNLARSGSPQLYVSWQADDPDGDRLVFALYYRAEDEREWKLIKADLTENIFQQEAEVFADGRYFFRVVASDRLVNSPASAREAELVSQPVLIDQTPPLVTLSAPRRVGSEILIDVEARDAVSAVRRAEYSLDGSPWRLLDPLDGVADSPLEHFTVRLPALSGEHSVVVRALDSAANPGLARLVLR
jgi:sugar lactone lactonase YvrE